MDIALSTTLGLGLVICAYQVLAIAHIFELPAVLLVVALGFAAACAQAPAWLRGGRGHAGSFAAWTGRDKAALAALGLVALPSLFAPLAPPMAFDELMYHLPYARQVAQSGSLGIHEWLRYPWFPYNYNLLYAAALMIGDDVLAHFMNALAGWLSVWMLYVFAARHTGRATALAAAAIWLGIGDYSNALIDMGVALFVLAAFVALWHWRDLGEARRTRWLVLGAFFLGVAAGAKYQALTFLPAAAVFVAWRERRGRAWLLAAAGFLGPCVYWYARNAVQTGDPFNPIGAKLFGYTNWIPADFAQQVYDVRIHAALPSYLIWPVLLAPFHRAWRDSAALRAVLIFCAYSIGVWLLTSRYPRYLTAAYPLIALGAVLGWQVLMSRVLGALGARGQGIAIGALLAALLGASVVQTDRKFEMISPTAAEREVFLRQHVPGYAVMSYLQQNVTGRVYQIALSEAIYYGPNPIWGDALGPWRYSDYVTLPPPALARKLDDEGFEAIVTTAALAQIMQAQPAFDRHFELIVEQDGARAYRILR